MRVLGIPRPIKIIAYLCVGYVKAFSSQPDLEKSGWRKRLPLDQLIHYESWGNRNGTNRKDTVEEKWPFSETIGFTNAGDYIENFLPARNEGEAELGEIVRRRNVYENLEGLYTYGRCREDPVSMVGKRLWKDSLRVDVYGTVDELNAIIGLARIFNAENVHVQQATREMENWLNGFRINCSILTESLLLPLGPRWRQSKGKPLHQSVGGNEDSWNTLYSILSPPLFLIRCRIDRIKIWQLNRFILKGLDLVIPRFVNLEFNDFRWWSIH